MKNIQSQHWSLKRKIMFPKNKTKTKTNEKNHTTNKKKGQKKKEQK